MGDKLGIDEIITMEDGEAKIKKSKPKLGDKIKKAKIAKLFKTAKQKKELVKKPKAKKGKRKGKAVDKTAKESEDVQEKDNIFKKDVAEIVKDAKPPTKDKALAVVEAALFMSNRPLMLDQLAKISGINSLGFLKQLLNRLQKDYETRGMDIVNTRSGWQMQVRQELLQHVAHLTPYSDIPEGCKRTLALIVYKEPMKQADLIKIQGNKAYTYIKQLRKRGLIKTEKKSRTMLVKLTQEFERYFGDERKKIRDAMIKEFGDPAKIFAEPKKEPAEEKKPDQKMQQAEQMIKQIKE
jgi:segregation and condensation protein B